jgi:hypothetical protein
VENLELEATSLKDVLLYLCGVPGAIDEPGLAQLIRHALQRNDMSSIAHIANMVRQRRTAPAQSFNESQDVDDSSGVFQFGRFQQQALPSAYTLDPSSFGSGENVARRSLNLDPQLYTQFEESGDMEEQDYAPSTGAYFN